MNTRSMAVVGALATLFATTALPNAASAQGDKMVKCQGVNDCKGQGGCKSAQNSCKGQNACKGKSFVTMSETDCKAKGGRALPEEQKPAPKPPPKQTPKT